AVLPEISVPTLLIHGDASHFYSVEVAEYVRGSIPDATLHVYAGSDHSPHLWQRERFLADLRAFCADR
ncbi:MAG TPA: alpha/beta hydrolase, partial [Gammaproteobacteria bacterium]